MLGCRDQAQAFLRGETLIKVDNISLKPTLIIDPTLYHVILNTMTNTFKLYLQLYKVLW